MRKIDPVLLILVIYIAQLVNADEDKVKNDGRDSNILKDEEIKQNKDTIDNNIKNNEDIDSIEKTLDENKNIIENNSKEEKDSLSNTGDTSNEKENIDSVEETVYPDIESFKGVVNSEKETIDSVEDTTDPEEEFDHVKESDDSENEDGTEDPFKPIIISQVKVIRDNVTGHKRSSFSEDKSENRGDEINISQLKEEAENRILEKEKEKDIHEGDDANTKNVGDSEKHPVKPEVIETDVKDSDISEQVEKTAHIDNDGENPGLNLPNDESLVVEPKDDNLAVEPKDESLPVEPKDDNLAVAPTDENKDGNIKETEKDDLDEKMFETNAKTNENKKETDDGSAEDPDKKKVEEGSDEKKIEESSEDEGEIPNSFLGQDDEFDSPSSHKVSSSNKETKNIPKEEPSIDNKDSMKDKTIESKEEAVKTHADIQAKEEGTSSEKDEKTKPPKKPTTSKKEAKVLPGATLYDDAMELLGKKDANKANKLLAYKFLAEAADINNTDAAEKIAYPYLFGDFIKRNKTKAVELFHSLAEKGNPLGQQGLGFIYGSGLNVNSSQAKALIYTTFGALGGNAMAQMMLGYRYFNGIGVAKSCESALTHYKKVAKKVTDETTSHGGNAVQRIRLYDELEQPGGTSGQIDEDLLQYYQFLADKGDLQAQVGLGQLYFQGGRGIDVNYEKAFKYFQLAGDVDNGNGLAYLGKMYLDGLHVEKDQKKAFEYFTKAAEQSNPIGQAGLGMIYLKGAGVKKDYDQAMKYFSQAAEQGWMEGQLQLGNMYYNGIGVKKDYRQAVKYFTFASQSGHVMAFYNLASMHATGAGVMRSCNTATELFKNVAERGKWSMMFMDAYDSYRAGDLETALLKYYYLAELGYEVAQSNVAYVLEKGELSWFSQNQTFARALLQWSRAAHQGYAVARVKVGDYHFYGYGTKVDYDAAALHYRMASDQQNNPQAMFNLGYMHEQGFGLKEDIHLAKRFYDMAAEASPDAHFPVTLALLKLTWFFTWEWVKKNYRFWEAAPFERWWLYILQKLGPDWDMYLITALAVLLGGLLLFRRTLRR